MLKPRIVQAADVVAYLPLYLAERGGFELQLSDGTALSWNEIFDSTFREPPKEYLQGVSDGNEVGDQGCLNAIRNAWNSVEQLPLIGICDPCNIVDFEELVLVGGLINRACFWCLVDQQAPNARSPEQLQVSHVFIHERGFLTGSRIGNRLLSRFPIGKDGEQKVVTGSFDLLIDGAIWQKQHQPTSSVAAISASILSCILAEERGFKRAFPIHTLDGYSEFLTTAIVVHRAALKIKSVRQALVLLMRSLSSSQAAAAAMNKTVSELETLCNVEKRFASERRLNCAMVQGHAIVPINDANLAELPPVRTDQARAVFHELHGLYSPDCDISENAWNAAMRLRERPLAAGKGFLDYFDGSILAEAKMTRLVGESAKTALDWSSLLRNTSWLGKLGITASIVILLIGAYYWISLPSGSRLFTAIPFAVALFWLTPSKTERGRNVRDLAIIVVWYALILAWLLNLTVALIFALEKNGAIDILGFFEFNDAAVRAQWARWSAIVSDTWEMVLGLLSATIALFTGWLRLSRAARYMPQWLRRSTKG